MLYDLNEYVAKMPEIDSFTLDGVYYEAGPMKESLKKRIEHIDNKKDLPGQWKLIIISYLNEWNDKIPEMTDENIDILVLFIKKKMGGEL